MFNRLYPESAMYEIANSLPFQIQASKITADISTEITLYYRYKYLENG